MIANFLAILAAAAAPMSPPVSAQTVSPAAASPAGGGDGGSMGYLSASELADRCGSSSPAGLSYCFAFIAGVHDTMRAYEAWLNQREFCVPAATPQADLRRSFLTYLSAYPSSRNGQASSVVVVALKETYPCRGAVGGDAPPAKSPPAAAPSRKAP